MNGMGAIILAAGESSRMGRCKAVLPLGEQTVLEHEVGLFRDAGLEHIAVVTGFHAPSIRPVIKRLGVLEVRNPHPERGMYSSVCVGIAALESLCAGVFILPVDIPLVRSCTLQLVEQAWRASGGGIAMPCIEGKSGHPPLMATSYAQAMRGWKGQCGLQGFFDTVADQIISVSVPDELMLLDMDTPEAYDVIRIRHEHARVPSPRECLALISEVRPIPENIRAHSVMVAGLARAMGERLNACGEHFDTDLLEAAGLLHDIARLERNHGPQGAKILDTMGFSAVARVIAPHSDMDIADNAPITHREIIFLADKYFKGNRPVSLATRYGAKMEQYGTHPEARDHVRRRLEHALKSEKRIEERSGAVLEDLAVAVAGRSETGDAG